MICCLQKYIKSTKERWGGKSGDADTGMYWTCHNNSTPILDWQWYRMISSCIWMVTWPTHRVLFTPVRGGGPNHLSKIYTNVCIRIYCVSTLSLHIESTIVLHYMSVCPPVPKFVTYRSSPNITIATVHHSVQDMLVFTTVIVKENRYRQYQFQHSFTWLNLSSQWYNITDIPLLIARLQNSIIPSPLTSM